MSKFNEWNKKYQPTIQTAGIVLVFLTLVVLIWQTVLTRSELKRNSQNAFNEALPKFKVTIEKSENAVVDEFIFSCVNQDYDLQKVEIVILNDATPSYFSTYSKKISTSPIKNKL